MKACDQRLDLWEYTTELSLSGQRQEMYDHWGMWEDAGTEDAKE